MSDFLISIVRDLTGKIVGGVLGLAAAAGVVVPADMSAGLTAVVSAVLLVAVQVAYYVAVRWAEKRWPIVGRLLGAARSPNYGLNVPVYLRAVVDGPSQADLAHVHNQVQQVVNDTVRAKTVRPHQ